MSRPARNPELGLEAPRPAVTLSGLAASPGIAIGVVHLIESLDLEVPDGDIPAAEVEGEVERFRRALARAREDVVFLRTSQAEEVGGEDAASIFDAQLLFLEDVMVVDAVIGDIQKERKPAAYLFRRRVGSMLESLEGAASSYLRERVDVFRDVKALVLRHLLDQGHDRRPPPEGGVLLGRELDPSDAARLDRDGVAGFATELGGMTSHAAILARSKGVPGVVGVKRLMLHARPGELAIVDGLRGEVLLNPEPGRLDAYRRRQAEFEAFEASLAALRAEPATTTDGRRLHLGANIDSPADLERALASGADGIGLYRTEFFYLEHARMPGEEEQLAAYRRVVEAMHPRPVIIRTMDVGGDKIGTLLGAPRESNPFLGWRGIRFSLEHRDSFRTQLRAIYRAGAAGEVKILLPMVTGIEEIRATRELEAEVAAELDRAGTPRGHAVELGIMVETPAAVLLADVFARAVDFFSVGSNDLIQYTLAVDRSNPKVASLYQPHHPAILRGLKRVVEAAREASIWVGICGEMAADPLAAVLLVGLGFDELSVSPNLVPEVKTVIRSIGDREARAVAAEALALDAAAEVRTLVTERVGHLLPQFLMR